MQEQTGPKSTVAILTEQLIAEFGQQAFLDLVQRYGNAAGQRAQAIGFELAERRESDRSAPAPRLPGMLPDTRRDSLLP